MLLQRVVAILNSLGMQYALIGGWALALRGYARFTTDTDLLTTDKRVLDAAVWSELTAEGTHVDVRRGDQFDPLRGVVHIGSKPHEVDVVVGKWIFEQQIIERAEPMQFEGVTVAVPRTSDLILLKLAAGGHQDYHDASRLLVLGPRQQLIAEVNAEIAKLPAGAQELWARLLSES